jgi:hypothetical protein
MNDENQLVAVQKNVSRTRAPGGADAIERARAHGVDIARLKAMLQLTPTERLEMLRACTPSSTSATQRAGAYGIDVSLLKLALTWTSTERVQKALELAATVRTLHQAGAKKHGAGACPQAVDEPRG